MHNIDLEKNILSTLMSVDNLLALSDSDLAATDFYAARHQIIFRAIRALHDNKMPYDAVMVADYLANRGDLDAAGGEDYLGELLTNAVASVNAFGGYVAQLQEFRARRNIKQTLNETLTQLKNFDTPIAQVIDNVFKHLNAQNIVDSDYSLVIDLLHDFVETLQAKSHGKIEPYIQTGFDELNGKLALNRGDLLIVAGRPSMGKSTFAQNLLLYITQYTRKTGVFFSLEMPKSMVIERLISAFGVNLSHIKTGNLTEHEWGVVTRASDLLKDMPLVIDDGSRTTVAQIRAKLNEIQHKQGQIGVVVVDYIGLMGGIGDDIVNGIGEITRQLKAIAKDFDCPVIALSQLNRALESRPDKRPKASDLRDSGRIEQDADQIIAIYRDEVYNQSSDKNAGLAEAIILKNRNGLIGTVNLGFEGQYSRFKNLIPQHMESAS